MSDDYYSSRIGSRKMSHDTQH